MRAASILVGLLLLAAGCGGGEETADLPLGRQITTTAGFTPSVHLFAEPVTASVDVVVDRDHLDPARIELQARFLPYDVVESRESRDDRGRLTHVRYEYVLRCLRIACIPEVVTSVLGDAETGRGERQSLRLPPATVVYDEPEGDGRGVARVKWPEVVAASRLRESDIPRFGYVFKTSVAPLPDPDYRVPPALLGAGLLAGALVLLALPIGVVAAWWLRRRPEPVIVDEPELTPLERALRLVEWASTREDGVERREALEQLAFELDALELWEAAVSARTLAWSAPSPTPDAAGVLVEEVRAADGKR